MSGFCFVASRPGEQPPLNLDKISEYLLLDYMQQWGKSKETKEKALNAALDAAGIQRDSERAKAFVEELPSIWRGEFWAEVAAIKALILKYKDGTA